MKIVIDTNVLLNTVELDKDNTYILLSHVNRELEKHKLYGDNELKFKARRACRFVEDNQEYFQFDIKDYKVSFDQNLDDSYVDNKIIQACIDNKYALMTNDLLLKQKARMFGIKLVDCLLSYNDDSYKGYKEVIVDNDELAELYQNIKENIFKLHINEYLILKNKRGKILDKRKWNGIEYVELKKSNSKKLKPMNDLQECAIDLLLDKNVPIKIVAGNYGSGKTVLSVKTALYSVLEKGWYAKIMMVRNPIGSGKEIGFLKGDKEEKTEGFFKPFIQHLDGGEQEAFQLEQKGVLLREIPYFLKGMSIEETIILCDEAEDLDVKLIRLIGTRLGRNSVVIFSGDYNQAENEYKNHNGLMTAIEKLKGNPLVGIIVLDEDVRSEASKVFAELE